MALKLPDLTRVMDSWSLDTGTLGVQGDEYLERAIVGQISLSANVPEDTTHPINVTNGMGKSSQGTNSYTLHFEKGALPPVEAFWSFTLYDGQGSQVENSLDRFALSSRMPLTYNGDGSLDLYFQNVDPGADKVGNWLPAPKGPFDVVLRLYGPTGAALTGKWSPPHMTRDDMAQVPSLR